MKLTKESQALLSFFSKKRCLEDVHLNKKTQGLIIELYKELLSGEHFLSSIKAKQGELFYNTKIQKINHVSQIPIPNLYSAKGFPEKVRKHIEHATTFYLEYSFSLFDRKILFKFIVEDGDLSKHMSKYNKYVDTMLLWMYILNQYASKECSSQLSVFLYFTSLKKILPESNVHILNENNVNTAYTTSCPKVSEIIIFRREEWFKVFIHETFHNFALDFSDVNTDSCTKKVLTIFPVKSDVNLFESYTEFWAKTINCIFCSYFSLKNKTNLDDFIKHFDYFINYERMYSFFQLVKVLNFMGLQYKNLYLKDKASTNARDVLYKEDTNVLSYYVITLILINNFQGFLNWCDVNNFSLLQFKKTSKNLQLFCQFIERNYKTMDMLENINCVEYFFKKLNDSLKRSNNVKKNNYIMDNLRMTICELG